MIVVTPVYLIPDLNFGYGVSNHLDDGAIYAVSVSKHHYYFLPHIKVTVTGSVMGVNFSFHLELVCIKIRVQY